MSFNHTENVLSTNGSTNSRRFSVVFNNGLAVLQLIIIIVAVLGNSFIALAFCRTIKMRTATNTLVVNMCIADFLSSLFEAPYWITIIAEIHLYKNKLLCGVLFAFEDLFQVASFIAICGLAFDRYFVLVKGWKRKMIRVKVKFTILCTWVLSVAATTPELFQLSNTERCLEFPHFYDPKTTSRTANLLLKIVCIILPILITYCFFFRIIIALRQRSRVGIENNYIQRNWSAEKFAIDAHSRSSKTAIILFSMYLTCTFPFCLTYIIDMVTGTLFKVINVAFAVHLVVSLRKPLFPAIYIFRNRAIQDTLRFLLLPKRSTHAASCSQDFSRAHKPKSGNSKDSCLVFGYSFCHLYRPRVYPGVYEGENKHFPDNIESYFTFDIGKQKTKSDGFTDIIKGISSTISQEGDRCTTSV